MRIADDRLHAGQAAGDQAPQKQQPELSIFARSDVEAQHFALAGVLDAGSDHRHNEHDRPFSRTLTDVTSSHTYG